MIDAHVGRPTPTADIRTKSTSASTAAPHGGSDAPGPSSRATEPGSGSTPVDNANDGARTLERHKPESVSHFARAAVDTGTEDESAHPHSDGSGVSRADTNSSEADTVVEDSNGTRVMTINMHQSVPGDLELGNDNVTPAVVEDIAAHARELGVDVLVVQEVVRDGNTGDDNHYGDQFQSLADELDATDGAFTPSVDNHRGDPDMDYGTATYTLNGYTLGQVHDIDLANPDDEDHDRSMSLAEVVRPDGGSFTVANLHASVKHTHRDAQFDQIEDIVDQVRNGEDVHYQAALTSDSPDTDVDSVARDLPRDIVLAGDFNATRDSVDDRFVDDAGLTNSLDAPELCTSLSTGDPDGGTFLGNDEDRHIDHILTSDGISATAVFVTEVPSHAVADYIDEHHPGAINTRPWTWLDDRPEDLVTDHRGQVVDLQFDS